MLGGPACGLWQLLALNKLSMNWCMPCVRGSLCAQVSDRFGPDAICRVVDPGLILSRANLTVRRGGRTLRASNSMLPVISSKGGWSGGRAGRVGLCQALQGTVGLPGSWLVL